MSVVLELAYASGGHLGQSAGAAYSLAAGFDLLNDDTTYRNEEGYCRWQPTAAPTITAEPQHQHGARAAPLSDAGAEAGCRRPVPTPAPTSWPLRRLADANTFWLHGERHTITCAEAGCERRRLDIPDFCCASRGGRFLSAAAEIVPESLTHLASRPSSFHVDIRGRSTNGLRDNLQRCAAKHRMCPRAVGTTADADTVVVGSVRRRGREHARTCARGRRERTRSRPLPARAPPTSPTACTGTSTMGVDGVREHLFDISRFGRHVVLELRVPAFVGTLGQSSGGFRRAARLTSTTTRPIASLWVTVAGSRRPRQPPSRPSRPTRSTSTSTTARRTTRSSRIDLAATSFSWTVPDSLAASSDYRVQVIDYANGLEGFSATFGIAPCIRAVAGAHERSDAFGDGAFAHARADAGTHERPDAPVPTPTDSPTSLPTPVPTPVPTPGPTTSTLLVLEPNANSAWAIGQTRTIKWRYSGTLVGTTGRVTLRVYLDSAFVTRPSPCS